MLTESQTATLKALAAGDPVASALMVAADDVGLASWFNAEANPVFIVLRTSLSRSEILHQPSPDGTLFKWQGNGYITRSDGERQAFRDMFDQFGFINPSLQNVQAAINDIFSGTGNGADNRTHIGACSRRRASRAERALATGAGTSVSPGLLTLQGDLSYADASAIRSA